MAIVPPAAALSAAVLASACSNLVLGDRASGPRAERIAVVAEAELYPDIARELAGYAADLEAAGHEARLLVFPGGSAADLRAFLWEGAPADEMAFLVGDLPFAEYEMRAFGHYERFPVDLFFSDDACAWSDADGNGVFDAHGPLSARKPVSRLTGSAQDIARYFAKLKDYRAGGFPEAAEAFIFKDDDWHDYKRGDAFGLERVAGRVSLFESVGDTVRTSYVRKLGAGPVAYVYQWVHAVPDALYFQENSGYESFGVADVDRTLPQGVFYNLFNCKAARFTQPNMGMRYLTGTPYGLAVLGSTKIGGNYYPVEFHRSLARGSSWGRAFAVWYDAYGKQSDEWFLGMEIFGCPALSLPASAARSAARALPAGIPAPFSEEPELLRELYRFAEEAE